MARYTEPIRFNATPAQRMALETMAAESYETEAAIMRRLIDAAWAKWCEQAYGPTLQEQRSNHGQETTTGTDFNPT